VPGSTAIMQVFKDFSSPLTVSVWGGIIGNDPALTPSIAGVVTNKTWGSEIGCYGLNGEDYSLINITLQTSDLKTSLMDINATIGAYPVTFTPPFADFTDPDTFTAAENNGIKYFSSSAAADPPPYNLNFPALWHFGSDASTNDPNNQTVNVGLNHTQIYAAIQVQLPRDGFCVVTVNPQEFSFYNGNGYSDTPVNAVMIQELRFLLAELKSAGIKIVTVGNIAANLNQTAPPTSASATTAAASTTVISSTAAVSSTVVSSTVVSSTAKPSSASSTAAPSSTASTGPPSSTAKPSSASSTAAPSSTASTAAPSSTASTALPSSTASTAVLSSAVSSEVSSGVKSSPFGTSASAAITASDSSQTCLSAMVIMVACLIILW